MAWSAAQYLKFEDERSRPARDLLAQVPFDTIDSAIDLGCGPGNSTELIVERFPDALVSGIDSDDDMLRAARARLPSVGFERADLGTWTPDEPVDLLFANAVFQWVPDHLAVMQSLFGCLRSGGYLAAQMPDNLDAPTHVLMEEVAISGPWASKFKDGRAKRSPLPSPRDYMAAFSKLGGKVNIWHTVYYHRLANASAIVDWVKGTGLRPWLDVLEPGEHDDYLDRYLARIAEAYPAFSDGSVILPFNRLFMVIGRP